MADGFTIDDSQLRALRLDLGKIPSKVTDGVEQVLAKGALNLKGAMRSEFEKSPSFRPVGAKVSYDPAPGIGILGFEIGPTVGGAGSLAAIAVEGGARGGGATVGIDHLLPAEAVDIERFVGDVLEGLL